jgi:hypothetical protein
MGNQLTDSIIVSVVGNIVMIVIFWFITHGIKNWIHEIILDELKTLTAKLDKISDIAIYNKTNTSQIKKEIVDIDHKTRKMLIKISNLNCIKGFDCENID